jgi:hypothetical protein
MIASLLLVHHLFGEKERESEGFELFMTPNARKHYFPLNDTTTSLRERGRASKEIF